MGIEDRCGCGGVTEVLNAAKLWREQDEAAQSVWEEDREGVWEGDRKWQKSFLKKPQK